MIVIERLVAHHFKQLHEVDLALPPSGRVLIEGLNEAGKSTLFEAVHFALYGRGLVTRGNGAGANDSLIAYGADRATVEAGLRIDECSLRVARTLRRGRTGDAVCEVRWSDGRSGEVRQWRKVNEEVLVHLHGLDSDALLASCLVEQKKLGRLEELTRQKRQDVLLKLLDLDRLTRVKRRFDWGRSDDRALDLAEQKLRLAEAARRVEELSRLLSELERKVAVVQIAVCLSDAAEYDRQAEELDRQLDRLGRRLTGVRGEIARTETMDRAIDVLDKLLAAEHAADMASGQAAEWDRELARLAQVERETIPSLQAELAAREAESPQRGDALIRELDRAAAAAENEYRAVAAQAKQTTLAVGVSLAVMLAGVLGLVLGPFAALLILVGLGLLVWSWRRRAAVLREVARCARLAGDKRARAHDERVRRIGQVEQQLKQAWDQVQKRPEAERRLEAARGEAAACQARGQALAASLSAIFGDREVPLERAMAERQLAALRVERAALDLEGTQRENAELLGDQGELVARLQRAEDDAVERRRMTRALILGLGIEPPPALSWSTLAPLLPDLAGARGDPSVRSRHLEAERSELRDQRAAEEGVAADLEVKLHLCRADLDLAACQEKARQLYHRQRVCDRAALVLDQVRENVLDAVLPNTLAYMRLLLPLLTAGRYHDAQLDQDTYKIEVWDSQVHDFVEKDVFSGATQDQFSLALRLGFALAALPQERGVRPGFLFLDEPVAGFDGQRRDALLTLLSSGELVEYFPQVFFAVPSGVFDRNPLGYLVRLDQGRVIESTLP